MSLSSFKKFEQRFQGKLKCFYERTIAVSMQIDSHLPKQTLPFFVFNATAFVLIFCAHDFK